ncbi:MAG: type II/IV secretion system ATPase subunit [Candidatus Omnitrophota bacterium]
MDDARIKLEEEFLNKVKSKITFSQPAAEKQKIILDAFCDFCNALGDKECEEKLSYLRDEKNKVDMLSGVQSYGIITPLLDDPEVEDIIINATGPVYVHHAKDGLKETDIHFETLQELELLIKKIAIYSGNDMSKKISNVDLPGMRGRVNIVYSPRGPDLTITIIKANPLSIVELIEEATLTSEMAALLWLYIEGAKVYPTNLVISGGPGSGKTTLLNALLSFIPTDQHVVVIEDTYELLTDWIGNVSRLESDDDLSLADLVKNSLRMRPDRIIIGEVRGSEAQDLATAMNIGKYCMATIHASSVRETILRLQSNPMNISETLVNLFDCFVVMRKINVNNRIHRVVEAIAETAGLEQKTVLISPLWGFDIASERFKKLSPTSVYRDKLSRSSGLSGREILEEIEMRRRFIDGLCKAGIRGIKDVAKYCEWYIKDPRQAFEEIKPYAQDKKFV